MECFKNSPSAPVENRWCGKPDLIGWGAEKEFASSVRVKGRRKCERGVQKSNIGTVFLTNLNIVKKNMIVNDFVQSILCPDWGDSGGWVLSHKVKHQRFDSQSGHMPGLGPG